MGTCKLRQRRSLQQQVPCSCRVRGLFIERRGKQAAAGEEVVEIGVVLEWRVGLKSILDPSLSAESAWRANGRC